MVIAAAGIAAAGTIGAGVMASDASRSASNAAARSQQATLDQQQQQLQAQIALQQQALNQQTQLSAPYRSFGESAIPQLAGMLGLNPQPVSNQPPPLNGAPGQQNQYAPLPNPTTGIQAQYAAAGMGGLGGGGAPIGGQYPNPGGLSAQNLGVGGGAYGPVNNPQFSVAPPGQQTMANTNGAQAGAQPGMYTPPAPTTNGVPNYGQVLGGYNNILGQLENAVGLTNAQGGAPNTAAMTSALRNSPGYQFQLEEANNNAKNQASSMQMGLSGNTLQSLEGIGQGLADNTYQQYLGNLGNTLGAYQGYVSDYQNYLGNLMNSLGVGQAAAVGQAANIGQSASSVGAAYQNAGAQSANANNNLANIYANQGANMANIYGNTIAGLTKTAGNAANNYTSQNTLNALNNPNGQSLYYGPSPSYTSDPGTLDAGGGYTFNT